MSLTMDELFEYYLNKNQNLTKENICQISWCKLIYFYLIQSKRLSCVDLFPIILSSLRSYLHPSRTIYSNYEIDLNSSTGRCVRLYSNQIICRIKLDKNDEHLSYYNKRCSQGRDIEKDVGCYFYALEDYGTDCECNQRIMNYDWFESNYSLYSSTHWFNQTMGEIKVFQLSNIHFGFKIIK